MQPEDLANAFSTFADKVDMMSEVVERFNTALAEFGANSAPAEEGVPEEQVSEAPRVPPTVQGEEQTQNIPNSVLSLLEATNAWKGE